jgi:hypothetical protein
LDQGCLATLAAVLTLMGVPVGLLYRQILQNHLATVQLLSAQVADLQGRLDRALGVAEGQTEVNKDLIKTSRRR